jgi:hypothetical protein
MRVDAVAAESVDFLRLKTVQRNLSEVIAAVSLCWRFLEILVMFYRAPE